MDQITTFTNYLLHQKRYSINTVTAYKTDLEQLIDFTISTYQITNPQEITSTIIRSWMVFLKEHEKSNRTINRKISSTKSFFKYLKKNGLINGNPFLKITTPKTPKPLPVFLNQEETGKLFSSDLFTNDYIGLRDETILDILYNTGMRVSELTSLKTTSINFDLNQIKVIGKRNKERIIPITPILKNKLINYLNIKNKEFENNELLFLTEKGKKIYQKLVYRLVNSYLSAVTNRSKKSPHILRHTFATHMLNNGADLNTIKEILGHSNLSATQVYTHNTIEKLKNIHKQAHPKA